MEKLGTSKLVLPTIIFKNAPYKHIPALVSKCDLWLLFYGIGCMVVYVADWCFSFQILTVESWLKRARKGFCGQNEDRCACVWELGVLKSIGQCGTRHTALSYWILSEKGDLVWGEDKLSSENCHHIGERSPRSSQRVWEG